MAADDPGRTMVATPRPSPPPQRAAREEDEPEDTAEHTEAEAEEEADAEAEVEEEMEAEAEAEAEVEAEGEDDGVRPRRTAMVAVLRATPALPAPPFFATEAVWCVRVCDVRRSAEVSRRLAIVEEHAGVTASWKALSARALPTDDASLGRPFWALLLKLIPKSQKTHFSSGFLCAFHCAQHGRRSRALCHPGGRGREGEGGPVQVARG